MESLINLMRDVQLQEQAAEQASLDAATGGSNILAMVEGYKTVLEQAKEANDMVVKVHNLLHLLFRIRRAKNIYCQFVLAACRRSVRGKSNSGN